MVRVPVRGSGSEFAAIEMETEPLPMPLATLVNVIHGALLCAVQPQLRFAIGLVGAVTLEAVVGQDREDVAQWHVEVVRAFVDAPGADGASAIGTRHLRRSAVRLLFRVARELGLASGDPSLDLQLPARSLSAARLLTEGVDTRVA